MMGDHDVTLAEQLGSATDINACFCVACGQPDELGLHDPSRCAGCGGANDPFTVADALTAFDTSCSEEPDLDDHARALHCAIVAARTPPQGIARDGSNREGFVNSPVAGETPDA